jgi:hypothetical protein
MAEYKKQPWVEEMIKNESTPKDLREYKTIEEFCEKNDTSISTYYYQASKPKHQKRIIEIALRYANNSTPKILEVLGEKAMTGDTKAIEMHLEYISRLSKKLDITSDGKTIFLPSEIMKKNGITSSPEDNS